MDEKGKKSMEEVLEKTKIFAKPWEEFVLFSFQTRFLKSITIVVLFSITSKHDEIA